VARGAGLHVCLYGFLFSGPLAVGDSGLYYVLCDKGCLTADMFAGTNFCFRGRPQLATLPSTIYGATKVV